MKENTAETDVANYELLYFYRDVVLFYERHVINNPLGYYVNDSRLVECLAKLGTKIILCNNSNIIVRPDSYKNKPETFIFLKPITIDSRRMSTLASFFGRLRNGFSHGTFSKVSIEGQEYICIEDYYSRRRKQLAMIAQIPVASFTILVELIKQIQNKR